MASETTLLVTGISLVASLFKICDFCLKIHEWLRARKSSPPIPPQSIFIVIQNSPGAIVRIDGPRKSSNS